MNLKGTILVVDDNPTNVKLLSLMVSMMGYETDQALNGVDALEKVKERKYDCILLDVMMPEVDGIEVCAVIKNSPDLKDIPIIVITALPEEQIRVRAHQAGANALLCKPANFSKLSQLFDLYLSNSYMLKTGLMEQNEATV